MCRYNYNSPFTSPLENDTRYQLHRERAMVHINTAAALLALISLVSSTTVGCVRDGTENEVTAGIQQACSSSNGLDKAKCNILGYNCDLCQTVDANSDILKDDPAFADTATWCKDHQYYDEDNLKQITYSLQGFARS
jgi:hypothetical protein